jgi:DNA-binding CsgD family transcriptional regulator
MVQLHDPRKARECLARGLVKLVNAKLASVWVLEKWSPTEPARVLHDAHAGLNMELTERWRQDGWYRDFRAHPLVPKLLRSGKRVVYALRSDLVADRDWERTELAQQISSLGCKWTLCGGFRMPGGSVLVMNAHLGTTQGHVHGDSGALHEVTEQDARRGLRMMRMVATELARHHHRMGIGSGELPVELPSTRLTAREKDVLMALLKGMSTKETAKQLGVRDQTAAGYIKNVYRHFNVHTRAELLAKFVKV